MKCWPKSNSGSVALAIDSRYGKREHSAGDVDFEPQLDDVVANGIPARLITPDSQNVVPAIVLVQNE
ncbi:hypothetical protein PQR02_33425 [Paraburkholderia sediminicola]|uniref:Uncharacterized protein n=1 Tax=Paraburkholderia rhynchosiae TaxID=487049 RepID=A0ACC7NNI0_9BURK